MAKETFITAYVAIKNNRVIHNGQEIYALKGHPAATESFAQGVYDFFAVNYPKFYKMDNLCKTGFLAAELMLRPLALNAQYQPQDIGLVFSNANSSIDTDLRYMTTVPIAPGPALFVYTLPNILMGEIAIRYQQKGESACFVFDIFDVPFQTEYINTLFDMEKVKSCIGGWADFYNGEGEAFFYLVEATNTHTQPKHDTKTVSKIFEEIWKN